MTIQTIKGTVLISRWPERVGQEIVIEFDDEREDMVQWLFNAERQKYMGRTNNEKRKD